MCSFHAGAVPIGDGFSCRTPIDVVRFSQMSEVKLLSQTASAFALALFRTLNE
jgi:hypothetical protein